jgi:TPR repeat protein
MTILDDEQHAGRAIEAGAYEEAVRLLLPLAERNSEYALLTLGWVYETAATGVFDLDTARSYYEHAAATGSATAHFHLGRIFEGDGQEAQARLAFERGAQLGDDECKSALARLIDSRDEKLAGNAMTAGAYEEALRLLRPLAERKSRYALLSLGWIYETGAAGTPDTDAARSCYERAATEGSDAAYHELGRLLSIQHDLSQARAAFEAGAVRRDLRCMYRLGRMMVEGRGGPADVAAGSVWLEKAAARGHIFAQRQLLAIEARNARTLLGRLSVGLKIALLAIRGAKEMWKSPDSDKVR